VRSTSHMRGPPVAILDDPGTHPQLVPRPFPLPRSYGDVSDPCHQMPSTGTGRAKSSTVASGLDVGGRHTRQPGAMQSPSPAPRHPRRTSPVVALGRLLVAALVLTLSVTGFRADADEVPSGSGRWPLSPRPHVVAGFDAPQTQWSSGHRGVDLAGGPGQAVLAALPGRVSFVGRIAGRGVVVVDHGGFRTTYEPVAATVAVGDTVRAGAQIGVLELFGSHCFPAWCLHWGLIQGRDRYLDPLTLVGATPVILLPLHTGALPALTPRQPDLFPTAPAPFHDRPLVLRPVPAGPSLYPGPARR
jgi:hypothetical protein